jgi:hypothetical protein
MLIGLVEQVRPSLLAQRCRTHREVALYLAQRVRASLRRDVALTERSRSTWHRESARCPRCEIAILPTVVTLSPRGAVACSLPLVKLLRAVPIALLAPVKMADIRPIQRKSTLKNVCSQKSINSNRNC